MPRLGRGGLHLPVACVRPARLRGQRRPRPPRAAGGRGRRRRRATAPSCSARRSSECAAGRDRGAMRDAPLRAHRAVRSPGDGPHGLGPARDGRSTGSSRAARRAASRARRADGVVRPLLTHLARGDRGVLPRHTASTVRTDATNHGTKRGLIRERLLPLLEELDPRARANLLALAAERPRLPRALEASLVELLLVARGHAHRRPRRRRARRARVRHPAARGDGHMGAVAARERPAGPRRPRAAAGGPSRRAGRVRCRICSWTRRCRGPSATTGRSSRPRTTRSSPSRASPRRPGGRARCASPGRSA